jgi:hypothetical protein
VSTVVIRTSKAGRDRVGDPMGRQLVGGTPAVASGTATRWALLTVTFRTVIGVAMLSAGWFEASARLTLAAQAPWIALSSSGAALVAMAQAVWVLRMRGAVSQRLADARLRSQALLAAAPTDVDGLPVCVAGADTRRYHRPDCAFVAGRSVTAINVEGHRLADRTRCEVCLP